MVSLARGLEDAVKTLSASSLSAIDWSFKSYGKERRSQVSSVALTRTYVPTAPLHTRPPTHSAPLFCLVEETSTQGPNYAGLNVYAELLLAVLPLMPNGLCSSVCSLAGFAMVNTDMKLGFSDSWNYSASEHLRTVGPQFNRETNRPTCDSQPQTPLRQQPRVATPDCCTHILPPPWPWSRIKNR